MSGAEARNVSSVVREVLLRLARREDDAAAAEAASVPYWAPIPDTVVGRRRAAAALRAEAEDVDGRAGPA
jgi:hypothetical protein